MFQLTASWHVGFYVRDAGAWSTRLLGNLSEVHGVRQAMKTLRPDRRTCTPTGFNKATKDQALTALIGQPTAQRLFLKVPRSRWPAGGRSSAACDGFGRCGGGGRGAWEGLRPRLEKVSSIETVYVCVCVYACTSL